MRFKRIAGLVLIVGLALGAGKLYAGLVSKPFTFTNNTVANANQVNSDFDTLYALVNGNLDSSNISAGAINTSDIADNAVNFNKIDWGTGANQVRGTETSTWRIAQGGANWIDIANPVLTGNRTWTLQDVSDTFVGRATTDTLTNKTLTSPTITGTVAGSATYSSVTLTSPSISSPNFTGDTAFDTDTLFVDSTNNRVGVGTSSPIRRLHVGAGGSGNTAEIIRINSGSGVSGGSPLLEFSRNNTFAGYLGIDGGSSVISGAGVTDMVFMGPGSFRFSADSGVTTDLLITSSGLQSPVIASPSITGTVAGGASYTGPTLTSPSVSGTVTLSSTPGFSGAATWASGQTFQAGMAVSAGQKIRTDGIAGDDYITRSSNDVMQFVAGGVEFMVGTSNGEIHLPAVNPPTANYANQNSMVKAYGLIDSDGTNLSVYNCTVTRTGTGAYTINFLTDFAAADAYSLVGSVNGVAFFNLGLQNAGSATIQIHNSGSALVDRKFSFIAIGTQ